VVGATLPPYSSCNCPIGFLGGAGSTSSQDLNECAFGQNPCVNGVCVNLVGSYSCTCNAGWAGRNCDQSASSPNVTWCTPVSPCINSAGCYECDSTNLQSPCSSSDIPTGQVTSFHCACNSGWQGKQCQTQIDYCTPTPCGANGVCLNTPGSGTNYACTCNTGYQGTTCQTKINNCLGVVGTACANGGTCLDGPGTSYTCQCTTAWTGPSCLTVAFAPGKISCPGGTCDCPANVDCKGVGQYATCDVIGCSADADCPVGDTCSGTLPSCSGSSPGKYCVTPSHSNSAIVAASTLRVF